MATQFGSLPEIINSIFCMQNESSCAHAFITICILQFGNFRHVEYIKTLFVGLSHFLFLSMAKRCHIYLYFSIGLLINKIFNGVMIDLMNSATRSFNLKCISIYFVHLYKYFVMWLEFALAYTIVAHHI